MALALGDRCLVSICPHPAVSAPLLYLAELAHVCPIWEMGDLTPALSSDPLLSTRLYCKWHRATDLSGPNP